MASGLALRNLLRRTKTTAIIGAVQGVSRPENVRMAHLLDIQVEKVTPAQFASFDRVATVDVQPHYFGDVAERADLVVDHHPEQPGYSAVFKDIRADYGSTSTILTEHLRAVDMDVSERVATAMLYAIKSDTLFFARQTNRQDLDAFTYLYPLADAALIRKMEGADITLERLDVGHPRGSGGTMADQVFSRVLGDVPREDFITYTADFFLQLEESGGRSSPASSTTCWCCRCAISATRATPASSCEVVRRDRQRRRPPRDGQGRRAAAGFAEKFGPVDGATRSTLDPPAGRAVRARHQRRREEADAVQR